MTRVAALVDRWNAYWFRPAPLADLSICRFLIVGYQLAFLLRPSFYAWWVREVPARPEFLYDPLPILRVLVPAVAWGYRPPADVLVAVYWVTVAAGFLALIGFRTTWNLLTFSVANIFMMALGYSFRDWHHDGLMQITLVILALSPSGAVLSVDHLWRHLRLSSARRQVELAPAIMDATSSMARWPLLLIRWLYALIYLSGALAKLGYGGLDWMNGYTLQYYMFEDGLRWGSELGVWMGQHHAFARILSWLTIFFEVTFVSVLVFPGLAWVYVPVGVALHTGIYAAMRAPFFEFLVIYSVFVPWAAALKRLSRSLALSRSRPPLEIFFDGQCLLCVRSMTVLRYFDWLNCVAFSDLETHGGRLTRTHRDISLEDCRREIHLVLPDGSVRKGFFAFRELAWYVPAWWPLLTVCYLPLASVIAPRLYRLVASRRTRPETCGVETCSLHSERR
jgi:predicted DCC family thiol-disulfide oxidoreductase YuxK